MKMIRMMRAAMEIVQDKNLERAQRKAERAEKRTAKKGWIWKQD